MENENGRRRYNCVTTLVCPDRKRLVKHCKPTLAILAVLCASLALAEDFKTTDGKEYKNAKVSRVEPDGIVLITKSGISKVYFIELPKEVQERFHYDAQQAAQYIEENRLARQQQAEESTKRAEQKATDLEMRRQQQEAEMQRQQQEAEMLRQQEAEQARQERNADQQRKIQTNAPSRSQEGIPEHTYELVQDYTIDFGGLRIRLKRGEQYHGRILVDHAEIDRDGRSYTVPSGILRPID
jgi:type IV secretory pathway VirB10-like protein